MSDTTVTAGHANEHHLIPERTFILVWVALLLLTGLTVAGSVFYPGHVGVLVAMLVTPAKAALILLYFMHLKYEKKVFKVMFLSAMGIYAVFMGLTFIDYLFR